MFKALGCTLLFVAFTVTANTNTVKSGGDTTTSKQGPNAFSQPATNLALTDRIDFSVGNSFFRNPWVAAPASTDARDGLGPLFNTNGCQNCHIKDGRGHAPQPGDSNAVSLLIRLSIPPQNAEQEAQQARDGVVPDPIYGGQLQDFSIPGAKPEGQIAINYRYFEVEFADGSKVELREPSFKIVDLNYGDLHQQIMMSPRIAPPMIGLGLLEAIPEQTIVAIAAAQHAADKGVSGKPNRVWDVEKNDFALGRFGWKAGQPTLMQQNAAAFNGDLGLTSHLFPMTDCTPAQKACHELPHGGEPEVSDEILEFVEFYSQHLAVPKRRNSKEPQVIAGEALFASANCIACHQTNIKTGEVPERPALSNQVIHPYTDLLLHDMGEGLADHRPEYLANGREWRTAPLWGLGYTDEVNGHTELLHDGRARNPMEAILWHGGEAEASKQQVLKMSASERAALLAFLDSL
ncbi:di-heme oxidoredictase family protein [Thaumasiovibrio subtropicus]|uniref:di-heme oxidoreductase family protein n=1 Tax=Thaumasiovibrio subtropicus TaxID=1891207 RepID=UPI000B35760C|nr:di-heme oxidoredictase family protein [Thaumasiovibrio subtropicus]